MKTLMSYIQECIDCDNTLWLLDTWFMNNDSERQEFMNMMVNSQNGKKIDITKLKELIKVSKLKERLPEFISFIENEIEQETKDEEYYIQELKRIYEFILSNKSPQNKWVA